MQKPAEHIHIPPQHQISPDECYSFYQEHVDFGHQLRTFTLNQSKDQMEIRRANVAEIERLKHHNHMLEVQLSQLGLAPQSQPPIGFSQFSQTIPQPVWMSMAQGSAAQTRLGSASTTSSINPTSRVNMPFLPPRSGSLEENTDDMNG